MSANRFRSPWPRARLMCAVVVPCLTACFAGCEESRGPGEERSAQPRLQQAGSAEGPLVGEEAACERYREALLDAVENTSCEDEITVLDCPDLIRPAGSAACTQFSEESLDACEELLDSHEKCNDFTRKRCLLVSVLDELTPGCLPPSTGSGIDAGGTISEAGVEGGVNQSSEAGGPQEDSPEAGASESTATSEAGAPDAADASMPAPEGGQPGLVDGGSVPLESGAAEPQDSGMGSSDDDVAEPIEAATSPSDASDASDAGDAAP